MPPEGGTLTRHPVQFQASWSLIPAFGVTVGLSNNQASPSKRWTAFGERHFALWSTHKPAARFVLVFGSGGFTWRNGFEAGAQFIGIQCLAGVEPERLRQPRTPPLRGEGQRSELGLAGDTRGKNGETAVERHLLPAETMIIVALLAVWFVASLLFCLALARAASRSLPTPDMAEEFASAPDFTYEEARPAARLHLQPAFARGLAVSS